MNPARLAVVSGTSSDSHMWNLVFIALVLEEQGFEVVNLGACVPAATLVQRCLDHRPALVAVGSVNGHGFHDGLRTVSAVRARPELAGTPVVIGGKLGVDGDLPAAGRAALLRAGFDAVFEGAAAVEEFVAFVSTAVAVPEADDRIRAGR